MPKSRRKFAAFLALPFLLAALLWPLAQRTKYERSSIALCQAAGGAGADLDKIEELIASGADVNYRFAQGRVRFPLLAAVFNSNDTDNRNVAVAQRLIKHGANVNFVDDYRETPLIYAARYGDIQMVKLLLSHGADVNVRNRDNLSPLQDAITRAQKSKLEDAPELQREFEQIIRLLRAAGARE